MKKRRITTIKIPLDLSKELESMKIIPRESKASVIERILKTSRMVK